ncbi:hypothetical protein FJZ40_03915 [Candidatus Shapirobacteria bacterium]|nr:hypothetical protein [Candidatus Shapirobacteria bacterium]
MPPAVTREFETTAGLAIDGLVEGERERYANLALRVSGLSADFAEVGGELAIKTAGDIDLVPLLDNTADPWVPVIWCMHTYLRDKQGRYRREDSYWPILGRPHGDHVLLTRGYRLHRAEIEHQEDADGPVVNVTVNTRSKSGAETILGPTTQSLAFIGEPLPLKITATHVITNFVAEGGGAILALAEIRGRPYEIVSRNDRALVLGHSFEPIGLAEATALDVLSICRNAGEWARKLSSCAANKKSLEPPTFRNIGKAADELERLIKEMLPEKILRGPTTP